MAVNSSITSMYPLLRRIYHKERNHRLCYCISLVELNRAQLLGVFPMSIKLAPVSFFTRLLHVKPRAGPRGEAPRTVPFLCKAPSSLPNCLSPFCIPTWGEGALLSFLSPPALHTCPTHQTQALAPLQLAFSEKNCWGRYERCSLLLRDFPAGNLHICLHCLCGAT